MGRPWRIRSFFSTYYFPWNLFFTEKFRLRSKFWIRLFFKEVKSKFGNWCFLALVSSHSFLCWNQCGINKETSQYPTQIHADRWEERSREEWWEYRWRRGKLRSWFGGEKCTSCLLSEVLRLWEVQPCRSWRIELLMVSLLNSEGRERKILLWHNFDIHFKFFFFFF